MATRARTCIWFDGRIEEAAKLYTSLVPDSHIQSVSHYPQGSEFPGPQAGDALTVEFSLAGTEYMLLNGGPQFPLSEVVSIALTVDDQAEIDRLWDALTADGGEESQCGWLKDRFGVSWQIVPSQLDALMTGAHAGAVSAALMQMRKIDLAALEAAAAG